MDTISENMGGHTVINLKEKIKNGEKTIGTIISMGELCVSDIFSRIGYDFLWIDMEHPYVSYEQVHQHTAIARANGTPVVVRIPQNDTVALKKVLEMGIDGIVFPMIKTAQEVKALVDYALYPPDGTRGFGPMAANRYGLTDAREYVAEANRKLCLFVQIETKEIIDELDEIMKNEYIDGYIFGPNDLSGAIGDFLNVYAEKTTKLMESVIEKLRENNKYIGIATGSTKQDVLSWWSNMDPDMVCAGGDYVFLTEGALALKSNLTKIHKDRV